MHIDIVGIGMGTPDSLTGDAWDALEHAEIAIGAARMLEAVCDENNVVRANPAAQVVQAATPNQVFSALESSDAEYVCLLCSGDVGFYSVAYPVCARIDADHPEWKYSLIPGVSSVQYFAARLGKVWQDASLVSAHGRACNVVGEVLAAPEVFLLTGGDRTPATIAQELVGAGLRNVHIAVGERLGYPDERIVAGSAKEVADQSFADLSVLWVSHDDLGNSAIAQYRGASGIPDDAFIRGKTPMSKRAVRALVTSMMHPHAGDIVFDVGAGTGSVSVELACLESRCSVFAIEQNSSAIDLIERNRSRFAAYNIEVIEACAPECFDGLPAPDAVFVGGSSGKAYEILDALLAENPHVRIVASAVSLESIGAYAKIFSELERQKRIFPYVATQIAASEARTAGSYHLLQAQNPVVIFEAEGAGYPDENEEIAPAQEVLDPIVDEVGYAPIADEQTQALPRALDAHEQGTIMLDDLADPVGSFGSDVPHAEYELYDEYGGYGDAATAIRNDATRAIPRTNGGNVQRRMIAKSDGRDPADRRPEHRFGRGYRGRK